VARGTSALGQKLTSRHVHIMPVIPLKAGNHLDYLKGSKAEQLPDLELIQPHAHRAFELLEAWVERGIAPPPSQCIQRRGSIVDRPQATECEILLEP